MNRKKGLALTLAGAVLAAVTLLGVFAATSDTADTGTLEVESATQGTALDLTIRDSVISSNTNCESGPHVENQTIEPLTITGANPGSTLTRFVCLRNNGDEEGNLGVELLNTTQTESGCDNDEPLADPDGAGCGTAGELADDVTVTVDFHSWNGDECDAAGQPIQHTITFNGVADTPVQFTPINAPNVVPDDAGCVRITATYNAATSATEQVQNQSDKVSWQFRFHAQLES